jgi:hypothetical protein
LVSVSYSRVIRDPERITMSRQTRRAALHFYSPRCPRTNTEPVAGYKLHEPVAGYKHPEPVAGYRHPEPVAGGRLPEPVAGRTFPEPVA